MPTPEPALLPGRFIPRIGRFDWPALDLEPGRTTVLTLSSIKVNDPLKVQVYNITPTGGGPEASFLSNSVVAVPPGKYLLWHNNTPSQKTEIEVADGQTLEINVQRQ